MNTQTTYKQDNENWLRKQEIKNWRREFSDATGEKWQEVHKRYLASELWKRIKAPILVRANGRCEDCGNHSKLDVHHKNYARIGGDEKQEDLIALCHECHKKADRKRERETSIRIEEEIEENIYDAGLNTFGKKKYGEDWETIPSYNVVKEEFDEWCEKNESEDDENYF